MLIVSVERMLLLAHLARRRRVLMRWHGDSRVLEVTPIAQVVVVVAVAEAIWALVAVQTIWMLVLLLLLWWRVRMVAQVIVIGIVSMVAIIAGVDVTARTAVLVVAEMDGRDMVLMGMRMMELLLIMVRWDLLLLLL